MIFPNGKRCTTTFDNGVMMVRGSRLITTYISGRELLVTTTVTADSQGLFKVQVDVLGDTTGTNYTMELTVTENNMSESMAVQAKR
jgi:hypothetical protein